MSFKINRHVLVWDVIIYLFVFQRALTSISIIFSYIDELLAIAIIICIILACLKRTNPFSKTENSILILLCATCIIGIISNLTSGIITKIYPVMIDVLSIIKVWLAYYAIIMTNWRSDVYDSLIMSLAKIGRLMVWVMLGCLIVSQVVDIGMTASARYGIKSFQFAYNVPGNFSKVFYFLIPLLTADLYYKSTKYKKIVIFFALLVWSSTMRSRAFAFITIYLMLAVYFFSVNGHKWGERIRKGIKFTYIIPVVLVAVIIVWKQLVFYFTTDTQARSVLLRYGILTMLSYFPLGAGFGTFGSDVAATSYSLLYIKYGFNNIYGMRQGEEYFLNDNYWPMIMGQFGVIGTALVLIVLYKFMKMLLKETKENKYFYFSIFCAIGFLLLSSVVSKSYSEFSSICVFMLMGVFVKRARKRVIIGDRVYNGQEEF